MKMINRKLQRTNSDIMRIITIALRDAKSSTLASVSVLNVDTSSDFAFARLSVEISGTDAEKQNIFTELEKASGFLRNEIAKNVRMRVTPQLRFILDKGRENAERVEELLSQIKKVN